MDHLQSLIISLIDHYGYGGLFVGMALGNVGAPIGAEIVLPVAGALTATGHLPLLWLTIVVAVLGELVGASGGYAIGRFGGRPIIDKYGKYIHLTHANLDRVHGFFERYGNFAIFICRFVPFVRGVASIPAGIAEMNLVHFYLWYALGSLIFCGALILLGNAVGAHLDSVLPMVHRFGLLVLIAAVVICLAAWAVIAMRRRRQVNPS